VRCPNCGFVSFDDLEQCKKCGFDLNAHRQGQPAQKASWLKRLRHAGEGEPEPRHSSARPTTPAVSTTSAADLRNQEERLQRERTRLAHQYSDADVADRVAIRSKLDELDRERAKLRRRIDLFEREHRARESAMREELETERQAVQAEKKKTGLLRAEMEQKLREAEEARLQAQAELEAAQKSRKEIENELHAALRDQQSIESDLIIARQTQERLAGELDVTRRQVAEHDRAKEEISVKAAELAAQQAEVRRLEDERRLLSEAAHQLQEERERLEMERLRQEKNRLLDARRQSPPTAETSQRAATARSAPRPSAGLAKPAALDDRAADRSTSPVFKPAARAEDLLELYSRPREHHDDAPPPAVVPPSPAGLETMPVDENDTEELLYEIEEEPRERERVVPKGGLLFRSLAAVIDLTLLSAVVGVFLVIGLLVSGAGAGGAWVKLGSLGLPFYIVFLLLAAAYFTYMHGVYGQTLGKRVLGLRVMTTHGEDLGYLNAFFRFVTTCFAVALLGMGVFWLALDPNKQGWHDKLSRTVVIRL